MGRLEISGRHGVSFSILGLRSPKSRAGDRVIETSRRTFCKLGIAAAASTALPRLEAAPGVSLVLDPRRQLERWSFWTNRDWDWYAANLPFWESPDRSIDEIYYYRAEVLTKHLRYASAETGYVFTEFSSAEPLSWAGRYNAIASAADLHLEEVRWLKTRQYAEDYARYWMKTAGAQPRAYGFPVAWSTWQMGLVHGDQRIAGGLLDEYIANFEGWERGRTDYPHDHGFDPRRQLFWNTGRDMGGEFNLASCQLNEPLRGIDGYKIRGGAGYRPDINAVLFGEARTIAALAAASGRPDIASTYARKAAMLQQHTHSDLWSPAQSFFLHRWRRDEYSEKDIAGSKSIREWSRIWETNVDRNGGVGYQPQQLGEGHGRELTGYIPWRFALPEDRAEYAEAWKFLLSTEYFKAPFGPTTAEQGDPWFHVVYHACRHNGQSWPFHTSRILSAGARLLDEYQHHGEFTREAWMEMFHTYARTQYENGRPHLAEAHSPFKDEWVQNEWPGLDYFHSSYIDLVLTGVAGLRPSDDGFLTVKPLAPESWDYFAADSITYRNHAISILWDRTGERYGQGRGLTLLVDGTVAARADRLTTLRMPIAQATTGPQPYEVILSANCERKPHPKPSASFTAKYTPQSAPLLGLTWFGQEYGDKWTCRGSWNDEDWYQVDFEQPEEIDAVRLFLYADDLEVAAPKSCTVLYAASELWRTVQIISTNPEQPQAHRANLYRFQPVRTRSVRVVFRHERGIGVGLAQMQVLAANARTDAGGHA